MRTSWGVVVRRWKPTASVLAALKVILAAPPDEAWISVILDNLSAHKLSVTVARRIDSGGWVFDQLPDEQGTVPLSDGLRCPIWRTDRGVARRRLPHRRRGWNTLTIVDIVDIVDPPARAFQYIKCESDAVITLADQSGEAIVTYDGSDGHFELAAAPTTCG